MPFEKEGVRFFLRLVQMVMIDSYPKIITHYFLMARTQRIREETQDTVIISVRVIRILRSVIDPIC